MANKNEEHLYSDGAIYLRPMTAEDTDDIVRWRNSDAVRTHFIYQELFTRRSHEQWIENMVNTGKVVQMIICECRTPSADGRSGAPGQAAVKPAKAEGAGECACGGGGIPVGSVYIRDIDTVHHKGEYGIFIGEPSARGRGIGTAAARLMIRYAFEELGLHRLFLRVFADNEQAIGSYEKAGFVREAYLRDDVCIDGVYRDMVLMAVINNE